MKLRKKTHWRPKLETLEARRLLSVNADFNGDGFDDLAIGVPGEDSNAGAVHVIYGTAAGLSSTGNQFWTQDSTDILDTKENGDLFGAALAASDFNNDGRADLAIGAPGENVGTPNVVDAGAFHILLGSATGLTATGNQFFHQDSPNVREFGEPGDQFGSALATGHFNNDVFADLVVGVPGEDLGDIVDGGSIHAFYGAPVGIVPRANQTFNLDSANMNGDAGIGDKFGFTLTSGDFNGNGNDDVAVGIPFADVPDGIGVANDGGAVSVLYGAANGIASLANQFLTEATPGISSTAFSHDEFGHAVAAGDFNGDGRHDLAIGVPLEFVGVNSAGSVHVLYGSASGVTTTGEQFFKQADAGGNSEDGDVFGNCLTAADFNGDGRDDLAIGAPVEKVGVFGPSGGAVNVMYGSSSGITTALALEIVQEDIGSGDVSEDIDHFGFTLSAGDFNGNGRADLAIGAMHEDIGTTVVDTGRVWTLYGAAPSGFTGGQSWGQDTPGILDFSETDDQFGGGLDAGAGRSAPGGGSDRPDLAHLLTADVEAESFLTKTNKRRLTGGRR